MKTSVYIDGFNLYYGALRDTPFKWLDLLALCRRVLPNDEIASIKYFSARLTARPGDPGQPMRQETYWRALRTISCLRIIEGRFLTKPIRMPLADIDPTRTVKVIKTEEKGSDVNLAVHLVHDAHKSDFELAVVISNDSDLLEAIRIVQSELSLPVGIINPYPKPSVVLESEAFFVKNIRRNQLRSSQFPPILTDLTGTFHKPANW
ncbi:MAG: NYN domain-containing protein [Pyrinomonadaceae bacterium]